MTDRDVRILQMMSHGHTNRDIAAALHVSVDTIKSRLKILFKELEVNNRAEAVRVALVAGHIQ